MTEFTPDFIELYRKYLRKHSRTIDEQVLSDALDEIERLRKLLAWRDSENDAVRRMLGDCGVTSKGHLGDLMMQLFNVLRDISGCDFSKNPFEFIKLQRAEIERLQGIVDKLPKTADGVQWYGQPVYYPLNNEYGIVSTEPCGEYFYAEMFEGGVEWVASFHIGYGVAAPVRVCYSTEAAAREAAEAAKEGK